MLHIQFVLKGSIDCLCAESGLPMNRVKMLSIMDAFDTHELFKVGDTTLYSHHYKIPTDHTQYLHTCTTLISHPVLDNRLVRCLPLQEYV